MAGEEKKEMPFVTKALIIAIIAVLVVVFSSGIAFFVTTSAIKSTGLAANQEKNGAEKKTEHGETTHKKKVGEIKTFGEFTLNLNEPESTYLVCKINLQMEYKEPDPKAKKTAAKSGGGHGGEAAAPAAEGALEGELKDNNIILQDKIQSILRSKSKADIAADPELKIIKKQLKDVFNSVLEEEKVEEIYFDKWMIQ